DTEWQWIAPEVLADESVLCTKSDVWSFGVVIYEIITFGEVPYAGLEKERTLHEISSGDFRLPIPKGQVQCPVEFYNTILQCWHQIPDHRLTFDWLYNYLLDFENASESEILSKDTHIDQTASNESVDITPGFEVKALFYNTPDTHVDQIASSKNVDITPGFDATALFDYRADADDEISFDPDDIITNIDPIDAGWWMGTTASGERGFFPANYVEVCARNTHIDQTPSNKNVDIIPGFDATAFYDYTAEDDNEISFDQGDIITNIDPIEIGCWMGTTANGERGKFPAHYVRVCIKHT
ncbi:fibroblast growth factor receptor-like, partial [Ruditapes philippinarum]|uniref:fibroblast growth factor receptor-like n=1 Tax=Ruditapes philippinarum TaxID=129788 RepID=UPI00295AE5A7